MASRATSGGSAPGADAKASAGCTRGRDSTQIKRPDSTPRVRSVRGQNGRRRGSHTFERRSLPLDGGFVPLVLQHALSRGGRCRRGHTKPGHIVPATTSGATRCPSCPVAVTASPPEGYTCPVSCSAGGGRRDERSVKMIETLGTSAVHGRLGRC